MELDKILELTTKALTKPNKKSNPIQSDSNPIANSSTTIVNPCKTDPPIKTVSYRADPDSEIIAVAKTFIIFNEI